MKKEANIKLNAILNVIKTFSSIIFPLITFPYISRVLQPENIGKINFSTSFVTYFSLIASLGITTYAIRECALVKNNKEKLNKISSQIFSINFYTTVLSYVLLLISLILFRKFDNYRTIIIIQSLTIAFNTAGCEWLNAAMEDYKYITVRSILFQFISLILLFIFVRCPDDYIKYVIITVLSASGASISNILYRRKYTNIKFLNRPNFKQHFKPIALLFVMILAQNIFNSSDITMIGFFKDDFSVGLYSTSVKITNLIAQLVASLVWVILPKMSNLFESNDYEKINAFLDKIFNVLLTIGIPCSIGTIMLSSDLIEIIAGSDYIGASMSLKILMVSFIFNLIGEFYLGNMILLPSKNEKLFMILCCISTVVNLIMNFFLIPLYGINAAACTTMISTLLLMIMLYITKNKKIKFNFKRVVISLINSLSVILICFCVEFFINNLYLRVFISIVVSVISYLVLLIAEKNELIIYGNNILKRIIRRK